MAAIRVIVKEGDSILRQKAATVRRFDERLGLLLDDMALTMKEEEGVGLAAPQIGISKCIIVVSEDGKKVYEFINPQIIEHSKEKVSDTEGCLSVPGVRGLVPRYKSLTVKAQDRFGEEFTMKASDFLARIIQHETDHLEGRLFIDIMTKEVD